MIQESSRAIALANIKLLIISIYFVREFTIFKHQSFDLTQT